MTRIPTQTIELMRRLRGEGYMLDEIARRTALSLTTVSKYCADIPPPINHSHPKRRIRAGEFYQCIDAEFDQ